MRKKSIPQSHNQTDVTQRILEAAGQLFADKGFDATSISDITEASGVGRGLLYYYFKNKRSLYEAVLQDGAERMFMISERAYAFKGTVLERLRNFIVEFHQLHIDRPNIMRVGMRAEFEGSLVSATQAPEGFQQMSSMLQRIIEEGIERGELRSIEPEKTVHIIMGIIHSLNVMCIQGVSSQCPNEDIEFAMSILAKGIATCK
ncbi:TetR/AcrR family transcriptional regulator [uncultured Desulfobulbus sp.]|uniref:TetR/AcrR family transcriptional regulator n=1 Tax=uncultured Desulfobulbus sp. TaxID=239745 RepID=UPI0029C95B19|nr:TetR/AcrR family transcriptional regulator [uncultured Desulfobulbus sp.]